MRSHFFPVRRTAKDSHNKTTGWRGWWRMKVKAESRRERSLRKKKDLCLFLFLSLSISFYLFLSLSISFYLFCVSDSDEDQNALGALFLFFVFVFVFVFGLNFVVCVLFYKTKTNKNVAAEDLEPMRDDPDSTSAFLCVVQTQKNKQVGKKSKRSLPPQVWNQTRRNENKRNKR
jgi:hypothetical protein